MRCPGLGTDEPHSEMRFCHGMPCEYGIPVDAMAAIALHPDRSDGRQLPVQSDVLAQVMVFVPLLEIDHDQALGAVRQGRLRTQALSSGSSPTDVPRNPGAAAVQAAGYELFLRTRSAQGVHAAGKGAPTRTAA